MAGRWEHRHRWSLDLIRTRRGVVLTLSCERCGIRHSIRPTPRQLAELTAPTQEVTMSDPTSPAVSLNPRFPIQRVLRTIVQVFTSLVAALAVIALVAPQILEALRDVLPETWFAWLVGVIAFVTAFSAALAKVMAIPMVNELLTKVRLGSVPLDAARQIIPGKTLRRDL